MTLYNYRITSWAAVDILQYHAVGDLEGFLVVTPFEISESLQEFWCRMHLYFDGSALFSQLRYSVPGMQAQ